MTKLADAQKALETALRRKKSLKKMVRNLAKQYELIKGEIELWQKEIESLLSESEYSEFLDTINLEDSMEFPIYYSFALFKA